MLILHGDNQSLSRQELHTRLAQERKNGKQIVELSGSSLSLSALVNSLESSSLFGSTNFVVLEGFFAGRASKEKKAVTEYLQAKVDSDMVIWEAKDVTAQLKSFPPAIVHKFEFPKYVFQFLENFSLELYRKSLQHMAPEQIFSLLVSHIHALLLASENAGSFPDWKLAKLKKQASGFTSEQLKGFIQDLIKIDYAQKTSTSVFDLSSSLEVWLTSVT